VAPLIATVTAEAIPVVAAFMVRLDDAVPARARPANQLERILVGAPMRARSLDANERLFART
jgi:hypothetical protein